MLDEKMQYNLVESSWGVEEIEALQEVIASNRFTMFLKKTLPKNLEPAML